MFDICFEDGPFFGFDIFEDSSVVGNYIKASQIIKQACPAAKSSIKYVEKGKLDNEFIVGFDFERFTASRCQKFISNVAYCCKNCQRLDIPIFICENCFSEYHKTNGHKYEVLKITKELEGKIKCSCGDLHVLKRSGVCEIHSQVSMVLQAYKETKQYLIDCFKILFELRYESYGILDPSSQLLKLSISYEKELLSYFNDISQGNTKQDWLKLLSDSLISPITINSGKRKVQQKSAIIIHLLNQQLIRQQQVSALKQLIRNNHFFFTSKTMTFIIRKIEEETMSHTLELANLMKRQKLPYWHNLLSWFIKQCEGSVDCFEIREIFPNKKQIFNKEYRIACVKILSFIIGQIFKNNLSLKPLKKFIQDFENQSLLFIDFIEKKMLDKFLVVMIANQQTEIFLSLLKQMQRAYKKSRDKQIIIVLNDWAKQILQMKDINFMPQKYLNRKIIPTIYVQIESIITENSANSKGLQQLLTSKIDPFPPNQLILPPQVPMEQDPVMPLTSPVELVQNLSVKPTKKKTQNLLPGNVKVSQLKRNKLNNKFSLVKSSLLLKFGLSEADEDTEDKQQSCVICRQTNQKGQHLCKIGFFASRRPALNQIINISFQSNYIFNSCMHTFHILCLIESIKKNGSLAEKCPLCKQNMNFAMFNKMEETGNIETEFLHNSQLGKLFKQKSLHQIVIEVYSTVVTSQYEYVLFSLLQKKMRKVEENIKNLQKEKQKIISLLNTLKSVLSVLDSKVKAQIRVQLFEKLNAAGKSTDKKSNPTITTLFLASWLFISKQKQFILSIIQSNDDRFTDFSILGQLFDQNIITVFSQKSMQEQDITCQNSLIDFYVPQLPAYSFLLYANFEPLCPYFRSHTKQYYLCLFCNKLICPFCNQKQTTHFSNLHNKQKLSMNFLTKMVCYQFIGTPIKRNYEIYTKTQKEDLGLVQEQKGSSLMKLDQLNKSQLYEIIHQIIKTLKL